MKNQQIRNNNEEYDTYELLIRGLNKMKNISELDEEQIISLKEKFKEVENSLKDKVKPKTITISGSNHNKIKKYCSEIGQSIGDWSEKILLKEINNLSRRKEIILINQLTEYKTVVEKKINFFDSEVNKKVNRINDVIFLLKDQLWDERERMRTINVDLNKHFNDYDTSQLEDSIIRGFNEDKFIIYFKNSDIIKKLKEKNLNKGDKCYIRTYMDLESHNKNETAMVEFIEFHSHFYYKTLGSNNYANDSLLLKFDANTFDANKKIETQINTIFGITLNSDDFVISPYYNLNKKNADNLEKENRIFDLNSYMMTHDKDFIYNKNKNYMSDFIYDRYKCADPVFIKTTDPLIKEKVQKEFNRYNIVNKYTLKDKEDRKKRIFTYIEDKEMPFELNEKYITNDHEVYHIGFKNVIEIMGYSKLDDSIIIAIFNFIEKSNYYDSPYFKTHSEIIIQSNLGYHI